MSVNDIHRCLKPTDQTVGDKTVDETTKGLQKRRL